MKEMGVKIGTRKHISTLIGSMNKNAVLNSGTILDAEFISLMQDEGSPIASGNIIAR